MVPFPQAVAMEEQQEVLSQTCRLIFEYADKLPRWGQLSSVNQGRVPRKPPTNAASHLLKSVLRRVQTRWGLQPAFQRLVELPPRLERVPSVGRQAWKRAGNVIRGHVKKQRELARQQEERQNAMKTVPTQKRSGNAARKSLHIL